MSITLPNNTVQFTNVECSSCFILLTCIMCVRSCGATVSACHFYSKGWLSWVPIQSQTHCSLSAQNISLKCWIAFLDITLVAGLQYVFVISKIAWPRSRDMDIDSLPSCPAQPTTQSTFCKDRWLTTFGLSPLRFNVNRNKKLNGENRINKQLRRQQQSENLKEIRHRCKVHLSFLYYYNCKYRRNTNNSFVVKMTGLAVWTQQGM